MKQDIHPTWYADARVTCQCGNSWTTGATVPEIRTEICSACHPFFTGEQRIVDTEGRVDKFMDRLRQRDRMREEAEARNTQIAPTDLPLSELGLNNRALHILEENGINTVQDVLDKLAADGEDSVLEFTGFGRQALSELRRSLRDRGYEIPRDDAEADEDNSAD